MSCESFSVVQVSDLHLDPARASSTERAREVRRCVDRLGPDLVVFSGDLTSDGHLNDGELEAARRELERYVAPVYAIPGNHDVGGDPLGADPVRAAHLARWRAAFGAERFGVRRGGWDLIGLNSQVIGTGLAAEGEQLDWLDGRLAEAAGRGQSVAVFSHQPPYLFDAEERFHDASDYWSYPAGAREAVVRRLECASVKLIASGHLHWYHERVEGGRRRVWCPSCSFIVDDAKFPAGGETLGVMRYRFEGREVTTELVRLAVAGASVETVRFNRPHVALPGGEGASIDRVLLDFSGTVSKEGELLPAVAERLERLARRVRVTVVTADTFGTARVALGGLPVELSRVGTGAEKAALLERLGPAGTAVIGNGRNDAAWVERAAIGIAVIGPEGAAGELVRVADVVTGGIADALDLVLHPKRLTATLRA